MIVDDILESKDCQFWTVHPDDTVFAALQLMAEKTISALLVMEGEELVGILSEHDYTVHIIGEGRDASLTRVGEIMTRQVINTSPDQSIEDCMHLMAFGRFRHLPVMIGDEVIGMISVQEILEAIMGKSGRRKAA